MIETDSLDDKLSWHRTRELEVTDILTLPKKMNDTVKNKKDKKIEYKKKNYWHKQHEDKIFRILKATTSVKLRDHRSN